MEKQEIEKYLNFTYPKINTLFKRDENHKFTDELFLEEFKVCSDWVVTEKIDGTNIRVFIVIYDDGFYEIIIKGRNEKSHVPKKINDYILDKLRSINMRTVFGTNKVICIFGEGYGNKVQKKAGQLYSDTEKFIIFDIKINDHWLNRKNIEEISKTLNIKVAPIFQNTFPDGGIYQVLYDIEELVCNMEYGLKNHSFFKNRLTDGYCEGIIARTDPLIYFKNGNPIMFKLRFSDLRMSPYKIKGE